MHSWLENYAYKVGLSAFPFILSIACLVLVTGVLIALQTLKMALTSPVKSLRTE